MNSNFRMVSMCSFCGACISFYIGAGFATMQEVMQYEASYGTLFPVVIFTAALIYVYTNISFATNGHRLGIKRGGDIYGVYCAVLGKKFGRLSANFFDYFSALFCYMSFIVMCGGANSTATQQWGLPIGTGAVILTILSVSTVVFGLRGILKALSNVGPIIIVMILFVSCITAFTGFQEFFVNIAAIDSGRFTEVMKQVGNGNPYASGASYGGFVVLWFAAFLAEVGAKNRLCEVNIGMLLSALFIFGTATICCVALIGHIVETAGADIPALVLANKINPLLAQLFAIVICAGIYTSAVPLLWTGITRIVQEDTGKYKLATVICGLSGCLVACFIPYKGLINVLYGLNGYLGFILVFLMILYDIRTKMSLNK